MPLGASSIGLLHAWGITFTVNFIINRDNNHDPDVSFIAFALILIYTRLVYCILIAMLAYVVVVFFGPI